MSGDTRQAWNEVGERFTRFGKHLSDRYKASAHADEEPGESQRKLEEAARQLSDQLSRAFGAFGETIRDEDAKKDLKEAVTAIGNAVGVTVTEAGEAIRRKTESASAQPETAEPAPRPDAEEQTPPPDGADEE